MPLPKVLRTSDVVKTMILMMMAVFFYVSTLELDNNAPPQTHVSSDAAVDSNFQNDAGSMLAVSNLKAENSQLKTDISSLTQRIETLASQTVTNPVPKSNDNSAELSAQLEQLQNANTQLKQQLSDAQRKQFSGGSGGGGGGSGDIVGRKVSGTAKDALQYTLQNGWGSSDVEVTTDQSHRSQTCLYQGNCNMHGENLLGKCFCLPGWGGKECDEVVSKDPCTNKDDLCFYTEEAGVYAISLDRWHLAQEAELATWNANSNNNPDVGDRIDEHMKDFKEYVDVGADGANLGNFIEVGSGPWTQSLAMMKKRSFKVDKYVIMEPGAINYSANMKSTVYRHGQIDGFDGKTVVINAGGEHLDVFQESFDTLMMINVLEHVNNGISMLRNLYNALKPGGMLIFNDRWWDSEGKPGSVRATMDMDVLYHPIRMKQAVFEQFLSGFDKIYEIRDQDSYAFTLPGRDYKGTYYIGRKKNMC